MPLLILLLFVSVPLVELYVLIQVGGEIGALPTILLCIGTAALGATLIRAQGLAQLERVRASLDRREVPAVEMVEAAMLLVAGMMLLTPGFVTDAIGFALLVPPFRAALARRFLTRRSSPLGGGPRGPRDEAPRVIEGEYRREDSE